MNARKIVFSKLHILVVIALFFLITVGMAMKTLAQTSESALKIEPGEQPSATIAPPSAKGIVFTKIKFTVIGTEDITVTNLIIKNTGLAENAVFSKVGVLGTPIYIDGGTLNEKREFETRSTKETGFTLKAGSVTEISLFGDMASSLSAYQWQSPALSLVRVDTAARIEGNLPVTGTSHTISSASIGAITLSRGPRDPGTAMNINPGEKDRILASAKVSINSIEPFIMKSAKWSREGSSIPSDISNVRVYVTYKGKTDEFKTTVSGKDYSASFGSGITIEKDDYAEVLIKGDIQAGEGRTIGFKLQGYNVIGTGATYGYTIKGGAAYTGSTHTIVSSVLSVSPSNLTYFRGESSLGEIDITVKGEDVEINSFELRIGSPDIRSVKLWDANGNLVAGPTDPADRRVRFTDKWVVPVGTFTYHVTAVSRGSFEIGDVVATGMNTKNTVRISGL